MTRYAWANSQEPVLIVLAMTAAIVANFAGTPLGQVGADRVRGEAYAG